MNTDAHQEWQQANQRYLMVALAVVRQYLKQHAARLQDTPSDESLEPVDAEMLSAAASALSVPAALDTLSRTFNLSSFERDVLLLCAGMELDGNFAALCAAAQSDAQRSYPTFGLALAALPNPDWSVLSLATPLQYWRLIEVKESLALTLSPLRIDPCILQYLLGIEHLDERLVGIVEQSYVGGNLPPSHLQLAERMATIWAETANRFPPIFQLCGDEVVGKRAIAIATCAQLGLALKMISAHALPAAPSELNNMIRLWEREAALFGSVLLLECDELETTDTTHAPAIQHLLEHANSLLIVTSRDRRSLPQRPMLSFDLGKPTVSEQRAIWQEALGDAAPSLNGQIDRLVFQFNLSAPMIRATCADALRQLGTAPTTLSTILWDTCRTQARPRLEDLGQRIESAGTWEDLVLPEAQRHILREIALQVRQQAKVYETWGFAKKSSRGQGTATLFAGPGGTGKTMAAEVLAQELRLDLYRIDLSAVVSKYIGETEKNLRRVFDAAEAGGAILLFDEADALFGKRSEVKDSHDRHANIQVSYLLQRMEAYQGLAILTTNLPDALDRAFLRRLRFIVKFPFPDAEQRALMWQRIFPKQTPTQGLDVHKLARLNMAGGNIRNIALSAAFLAAEDGQPVTMAHLQRAARSEYAKLEQTLTEAEIRGWV